MDQRDFEEFVKLNRLFCETVGRSVLIRGGLFTQYPKLRYHIHTSAVDSNLIPPEFTAVQKSFVYAGEAGVLNVALFGVTAKNAVKRANSYLIQRAWRPSVLRNSRM